MSRTSRIYLWFIAITSLASHVPLNAQENWLDDQTVAVIRLSVEQPQLVSAWLDMFAATGKPVANEMNVWKDQLTSLSQSVQAAGGKEWLIVYTMADSLTDQPFLVFPGARSIDQNVVGSTFISNGALNLLRQAPRYRSSTTEGNSIVGTAETLARLASLKASTSTAINEQIKRPLGDNLLTVTVSLNRDQRRAVSEMTGALPTYVGEGRVSDVLTEVEAMHIDVTKSQQLKITLIGRTDAIAARLKGIQAKLTSGSPSATTTTPSLVKVLVDQVLSQPPQQNNSSLTWTVQLADLLKSELGVAMGKALLESDQMTAKQRLKNIGLALHNYYSAYEKFPSVTMAGDKPRQLSWRVDVLPFLGYKELWKEFRQDEPWDSEHNKKLIPRMPDVFRCPQSKYRPSDGLSTFVLPVHAQAMWSKTWSTEFKGITDGTSNTIMTIEVPDDSAQVWTKPDAFEVDLSAPEKQFGGHFEDKIFFGAGDGSAGVLSKTQFKDLPALITRAGGEVVSW